MTVDEAERHIARVLCGLEKEHHGYVEKLEVFDVDVTRVGDERNQFDRRVRITFKRKPGSRWTT